MLWSETHCVYHCIDEIRISAIIIGDVHLFQLYSLFLSAGATPLAEDCTVQGWVKGLDAGIMAVMRFVSLWY